MHISEGKVGLPKLDKKEITEMTEEEFEDYKRQKGVEK
jgi:hypothetical protein